MLLCDYATKIAKMFNSLSTKELRQLAYKHAQTCKLVRIPSAWKREQCATRDWCYAFMARHPHLTLKASESTSQEADTSDVIPKEGRHPESSEEEAELQDSSEDSDESFDIPVPKQTKFKLRKCCVPGCRSSDSSHCPTSLFCFPKDEDRRDQWRRAIPWKNFTLTDDTVLCEKHFVPEFIIREVTFTTPDGTVLTAKRDTPKLAKDAFPSLFPNLLRHLFKEGPTKLTAEGEQYALLLDSKAVLNLWNEKDHIENFSHFCDEYEKRLTGDWISIVNNDSVSFVIIDCSDQPKVIVSFKVKVDLSVSAWHNGIGLSPTKFNWILQSDNLCTRWSMFDSLLSYFRTYQYESTTDMDMVEDFISVFKEEIKEEIMD